MRVHIYGKLSLVSPNHAVFVLCFIVVKVNNCKTIPVFLCLFKLNVTFEGFSHNDIDKLNGLLFLINSLSIIIILEHVVIILKKRLFDTQRVQFKTFDCNGIRKVRRVNILKLERAPLRSLRCCT